MLCELSPWLLDSLDFMIEQLQSAKSPEDQLAGTDAAMGLIPFLRCRLKEEQNLAAQFALGLHIYIDADHYKSIWTAKANLAPAEFSNWADELIGDLKALRNIVATPLISENEDAAD